MDLPRQIPSTIANMNFLRSSEIAKSWLTILTYVHAFMHFAFLPVNWITDPCVCSIRTCICTATASCMQHNYARSIFACVWSMCTCTHHTCMYVCMYVHWFVLVCLDVVPLWHLGCAVLGTSRQDDDRRELLQLPDSKLEAVAKWCNRYPDIDIKYEIADADDITTADPVTVQVNSTIFCTWWNERIYINH